jgi:Spy/CpxP family protein refolding chaperone
MRKLLLTGALVALLATPILAQRPGGGRRDFTPLLLADKTVQEELKLTDKQKAAIRKAAEARDAAFKKAREDRDFSGLRTAFEDYNKAVTKVKEDLKPEQTKRLKQISRQVAGPQAFNQPDVQKALKLTDKQKDEVKEIAGELTKGAREIMDNARGGGREKMVEAQKKIAKLRKEAVAKITKTFNADQKEAWKELTGKPVDVQLGDPDGFGGGGRPPREKPKD